ncbi:hypothetical protein G9F71_008645 [Clostridium sp. FP2]|uniref:hypothetical protein n=1 Tax=Clostridium sp. FP2 TaxID=2724481 RepID=UPI0013E98A16|nr:hypothetical protein [Clostridium sp. FP2]MBZ9622921.1 hypothetical protein [Clostridium sp. FP2]
MQLTKIRSLKVWLYEYESIQEKEEHKNNMLLAKFLIEKESELSVEYSQVVKESE